jgi:hypothetical protein
VFCFFAAGLRGIQLGDQIDHHLLQNFRALRQLFGVDGHCNNYRRKRFRRPGEMRETANVYAASAMFLR